MGKLSLRHRRISESISVALVKDTKTDVKVWRHRFLGTKTNGMSGRQTFKDYSFECFRSIEEFKLYIEKEIEDEVRRRQ